MKAIDRLYQYFENNDVKPTALEKAIGLSNGYFGAMRKKKADIGESALNKVLEYFRDINPEWLLTGSGPMLKGGNVQQVGDNSGFMGQIGTMHGGEVHIEHNGGKDQVIEKQEQQVSRAFEAHLSSMEKFHDILDRKDEYTLKQDAYIDRIVKESYHRNERNMERIDRLIGIISKGRMDMQEQLVKNQEQIDRILAMLEKKI